MWAESWWYGVHFLAVVGLLILGKWALLSGLVTFMRAYVLSRLAKRNLVVEYRGRWAVVTGSTDGIGKEYARQLAQKGLNIVLIARSSEKLQKVAQEIRHEFNVDTQTIIADFSHGQQIYSGIAEVLKGKDIGILVNNVGYFGPKPREFMEVTEEDVWRFVNVNTASVVAMVQIVLPQMVARGRGAIINISSIAALFPWPRCGVYSATKAFVSYFSQTLDYEYRDKGITVQTVEPGLVVTNMTSYSIHAQKPGIFAPTAHRFVKSALRKLGFVRITSGTFYHALQAKFFELCGKRLSMYLMERLCLHLEEGIPTEKRQKKE